MKDNNLYQPDTDFPFSIGRPAGGALKHAGYFKLKQLTKLTEAELLQMHGVGPKAVGILRELLKEKGMYFATASKPKVTRRGLRQKEAPFGSAQDVSASVVERFMKNLDNPYKAEVEVVREIIKKVNKDIAEEIKWNAPSFSYKGEYLVTFNLWEKKRIHLVFHNPMISKVRSTLLEGDYEHRRMTYFADMKEIKAKKLALEKVLKDLIKLQKK